MRERGVRAEMGLAASAARHERGGRRENSALVRSQDSGSAQQQGALARAGSAGDADALAGRDGQRHAIERDHLRRAAGDSGAITAGDAAEFECEWRHGDKVCAP